VSVRVTPAYLRQCGYSLPLEPLKPQRKRKAKAVLRLPEGGAGRWSLWLPTWHPPSLNVVRRQHWSKESRIKSAIAEHLYYTCMQAKVTAAQGKRRLALTLVMGKGQRCIDRSNLGKLLLDPCVWIGMIRNDSPRWLSEPEAVYERAAEWGTRIDVSDVTEGVS